MEISFGSTSTVLHGKILIGLSESELNDLVKGVGFTKTYTELKPWGWKPVTDFYFRFEK